MIGSKIHDRMDVGATKLIDQPRHLVSIVIPMLNERDSIRPLFDRVASVIGQVAVQWEIIVVDDGSTDGSRDVIVTELARFPRWRLVLLSRSFGQQPAYRAGLDQASGDAVIFLDADLQDPPELIPQLIAQWQKGFKVVTGTRIDRAERGLRRIQLDLFHRLFHRMTSQVMPVNSGMFSLVDRVVVDQLIAARENNLFLPALKCWYGFPQTTLNYSRKVRVVGESKQSFPKLICYALDGMFSFSEKPLQWIATIGAIICLVSFGYSVVLVVEKILQMYGYFSSLQVLGFTTLATGVFFFGGLNLFALGIVGQYLARIYREIKGRPLYVVERVLEGTMKSQAPPVPPVSQSDCANKS